MTGSFVKRRHNHNYTHFPVDPVKAVREDRWVVCVGEGVRCGGTVRKKV
jgi:hypothetical protein